MTFKVQGWFWKVDVIKKSSTKKKKKKKKENSNVSSKTLEGSGTSSSFIDLFVFFLQESEKNPAQHQVPCRQRLSQTNVDHLLEQGQ